MLSAFICSPLILCAMSQLMVTTSSRWLSDDDDINTKPGRLRHWALLGSTVLAAHWHGTTRTWSDGCAVLTVHWPHVPEVIAALCWPYTDHTYLKWWLRCFSAPMAVCSRARKSWRWRMLPHWNARPVTSPSGTLWRLRAGNSSKSLSWTPADGNRSECLTCIGQVRVFNMNRSGQVRVFNVNRSGQVSV